VQLLLLLLLLVGKPVYGLTGSAGTTGAGQTACRLGCLPVYGTRAN